jgi:hypothetical protein
LHTFGNQFLAFDEAASSFFLCDFLLENFSAFEDFWRLFR